MNIKQAISQNGFSMVEVLITILILSIGLLGIAGLQMSSLRISHESHIRSEATQLSHDIINKMRSNRMSDYAGAAIPAVPPATVCDGGTANCTPNQIRNWDLYRWNQEILGKFPNAIPSIVDITDATINAGTDANGNLQPVFNISITFDELDDSIALDANNNRANSTVTMNLNTSL